MVTRYAVIIPLWCSGGGGSHDRVKLVEVVRRTVRAVGALEGAGRDMMGELLTTVSKTKGN